MNHEFVNVNNIIGVRPIDKYGTLGFPAKDCGPSTLKEGKNIVLLTKNKHERCEASINGFVLFTGTFNFVKDKLDRDFPNLEIIDCYTPAN